MDSLRASPSDAASGDDAADRNQGSLPAARRSWFNPGVALFVVMAASVATIALARLTAPPPAAVPAADIAQRRVLAFHDQPDGSVLAVDAGSGDEVRRFEGEQGFLRGTLRAMARERRLHGIGPEQPLELILYRDGRLTLHDPSTGMRIALESFGSTNTGVFARLLR